MDDKDERELKLEIVCLTFSSFNTMPENSSKQILWLVLPDEI